MTIVEASIIRVQVSRLPGRRNRQPKTLWLWWAGPEGTTPDLDRVWRAYIRRFDIEHTIRFAKQTLGATTPKVRTPQQADRWTWLVLAALTQLRLARNLVADHRLPWQPPLAADDPWPGPGRFRLSTSTRGHSSYLAETLPTGPGTAQGPKIQARTPLSSGQEGRRPAPPKSKTSLNAKLSSGRPRTGSALKVPQPAGLLVPTQCPGWGPERQPSDRRCAQPPQTVIASRLARPHPGRRQRLAGTSACTAVRGRSVLRCSGRANHHDP